MMRLFVLLLLSVTFVNGLCYLPDGTPTNDQPCDRDAKHSVCCQAGYLCMSNGLCEDPDAFKAGSQTLSRQSCTDKSWEAAECPSTCIGENPSGNEYATRCSTSKDAAGDSWCCSEVDCCSDDDSTRYQLGDIVVTATAQVREAPATSTTETSSATGTKAAPPTDTGKHDDDSGSNTLAIGLGVGLGVGAVLIGVAAGLWFLRRRKRRAAQESAASDAQFAEYSDQPKAVHEVPTPDPLVEATGDSEWVQMLPTKDQQAVELPAYGQGEDPRSHS